MGREESVAAKTTHKKKRLLEALEQSLGVVSTACKSLNLDRSTHYRWMEKDEEYAKEVRRIEDVTLDFAEHALHKQINDGNTSATIFYLKTKGKKRGYIETQELQHTVVEKPIFNGLDLDVQDGTDKDNSAG